MSNMIIGLGCAGNNIIKLASTSTVLDDVTMYAIDSVSSTIDLDSVSRIKYKPIISDERQGSGRIRERGQAMYEFHESNGEFDDMYKDAEEAVSPIILISSAAGGTGSGSIVPACKALIERDIHVIPIIICPNKNDPAAFHMNANDLFVELGEIGVSTYAIFENRYGDANYGPINQEIVEFIEIILGRHYEKNDVDSIDDSDLDVILGKAGRIIAVKAEAKSIPLLSKELVRKCFTGPQPAWDSATMNTPTVVTAFALKSMFAKDDFENAFIEIKNRFNPKSIYDEYRHIVNDDNNGMCSGSIIISGLPATELTVVDNVFDEAQTIGSGIKKSTRPNFMKKKKATIVDDKASDGSNAIRKRFTWGK